MNVLKLSLASLLALSLAMPSRVSADFDSLLKNVTSAASAVSDTANAVSSIVGAVSNDGAKKPQAAVANGTNPAIALEDDGDLFDGSLDDGCEQPQKLENPFPNFGAGLDKSDPPQSPSGKEADPQTVKVNAKGVGTTIIDAKMAGGRTAIEQVVGMLVDAQTLVENEELVQDRILTYSGAFLESIKIVGEPKKSSEGLYTVEVEAEVRKTQLAQKLETERITKTKVDGGSLFANVISRQQEAADAAAILEPEFAKFPYKLVKTKLGKKADGSPALKVNAKDGTVIARVELSVDKEAYNEWVKGLKAKLDKIATDCKTHQAQVTGGRAVGSVRNRVDIDQDLMPCDDNGVAGTEKTLDFDWHKCTGSIDEETHIFLVTSTRDKSAAVQILDYRFTGDKVDTLKKLLFRYRFDCCECSASLTTEDGDVIATGKSELPNMEGCVSLDLNSSSSYTSSRGCFIAPWVFGNVITFSTPAKHVFVDFGKVATEDLADVTDCATSVKFLASGHKFKGQKVSGYVDIADDLELKER